MMSRLIRCQDHFISSTDFIWNDSSHYSAVSDVNEVNDRILCSHFQWQSMTHPCFMVTQRHFQCSRQYSAVDDRLPDSWWQTPRQSMTQSTTLCSRWPARRRTCPQSDKGRTRGWGDLVHKPEGKKSVLKWCELQNHKKEWKILIYSAKWIENWKYCTSFKHKILLTSAKRASLGFLGLKGPCFFACSTWAVVIKIIMHLHL